MNPNDYDNDGNNIVPCPICLDVHCPGNQFDQNGNKVGDGVCPEEADFVKWHTQKEMDVVYVLGSGSKWQDNELRYSLRSLQYVPHRNVVIVGERPEWLQNIIHIKVDDTFAAVHGGKFKNVIRKTIAACKDARVSDSFVLMNDDFFFLDYVNEIKPFSNGYLHEMIETYHDPKSQYYNMLLRTSRLLKQHDIDRPISYAVHYPIVYEKTKFLQMTEVIDWLEKAYSWRTIYGNLFKIGDVGRLDPKVSTAEGFEAFNVKDFLSISDNLALDPKFQEWIAGRFPEPSNYEKVN